MSKVDQFESVFRAAERDVYVHEPVEYPNILVLTDKLADEGGSEFVADVRRYLGVLGDGPTWHTAFGDEGRTVEELLEIVERHQPDLVCTYRNLHTSAWRWPYSLGVHVDVLTQSATCPVLLLPHPDAGRALDHAVDDTNRVMAMTDHLVGDDTLVHYAAGLTEPGGTLFLTHVEDASAFDRFIDAVSKVPAIDTDQVRDGVLARLLKEPRDYVVSCAAGLKEAGVDVVIEEVVVVGHGLSEYRRLIEEHEVDLLVLYARDEGQLAMHGRAYPLAVELREIPLLLLTGASS